MDEKVLSFAVPAVLICTLLARAWVNAGRARGNLVALASRLSLEVIETGKGIKTRKLKGALRGRATEIYSYTTGSGKSRRGWLAVSVSLNAPVRLSFSLTRRIPLFEFIARHFRKNEVATGDNAFDRRWVLTTNQPDLMSTALLPEMREKILRFSTGSAGNFKCESGALQYAEQDSFSSAKACNRLELVAPLLCDLADLVEVGAELNH